MWSRINLDCHKAGPCIESMTVNPDEILVVVDEDNKVIDQKYRKEVHKKGLWHRTAHIWITNGKGQLLCHRRSLKKDSDPGMWDPRFGGHLGVNQNFTDGAIEETREEVGLKFSEKQLRELGVFKSDADKEFQGDFEAIWNGDLATLNLEQDEIDEVKWFSFEEIEELCRSGADGWYMSKAESQIYPKLTK